MTSFQPLLSRLLRVPQRGVAVASARSTFSSTPWNNPPTDHSQLLDQFRDDLNSVERENAPVGRSWHARELRRKSFPDLHKLWLVLYKERNLLHTEKRLARVHQMEFPQPERIFKVKKSMGAIKQVLGERKRDKIAAVALRHMQEAEKQAERMLEEEDSDGEEEEEEEEEVKEEVKETQKV